jgi:ankyrin repeat protein
MCCAFQTWFWSFLQFILAEMASFWNAAYDGDIQRVKEILDSGVGVNEMKVKISSLSLSISCQDNTSALHRAAIADQNAMATFLLERGADPFLRNQVRDYAQSFLKSFVVWRDSIGLGKKIQEPSMPKYLRRCRKE